MVWRSSGFGAAVAAGEVTGTLAMADDVPSWHPEDVSARALPTDGGWRAQRYQALGDRRTRCRRDRGRRPM